MNPRDPEKYFRKSKRIRKWNITKVIKINKNLESINVTPIF
jgi:hypothetical protein